MVNGFDYTVLPCMDRAYRPLIQAQFRPDVIDPAADLDAYRMIFSPFLPIARRSRSARAAADVDRGGRDVDRRADVRHPHARCDQVHARALRLRSRSGRASAASTRSPASRAIFGIRWSDGRESQGSIWYDSFELRGAEALATYTEGPLKGLAAVARQKDGRGQIIVLGTMPQPADLQVLFVSFGQIAGVNRSAEATESLVIVPREGAAGKGMVVVEVENRPGGLVAQEPMVDLLTGNRHQGGIEVPAYGVMVLQEV